MQSKAFNQQLERTADAAAQPQQRWPRDCAAQVTGVTERENTLQANGRKFRLVFLCVMVLASLACSQKPSESDARQMLESYLRERLDSDTVQVVSLHKTDGLAEVDKGAKYYTMD